MAILDERSFDFTSSSVEQTERLGMRIGELLQARDVVCLSGELGAGKTVLARGIGRGWGTAARVTSPTYVLVNEYPRLRDGTILYHVDCYRLESSFDLVTAGLEYIIEQPGAMVIEWAERMAALLPEDRLWITLSYESPTKRRLRFAADGDRAVELLKQFRKRAFGV
jgi:tRNA threonylcarbamoyladenosine biosynthesis protein TsaE